MPPNQQTARDREKLGVLYPKFMNMTNEINYKKMKQA